MDSAITTEMVATAKKECVFVTGAAGYLGQVLVPMLLERGHSVVAFDPVIDASFEFPLAPKDAKDRLHLVKGDICSRNDMENALDASVTVVLHLAAMVGAPNCQKAPEKAQRVNVEGTQTLLKVMAQREKTQKIKLIFASTDSVYGIQTGVDVVDEKCVPNPTSIYAETKVAGEMLSLAHGAIVLRQVTMFGSSPHWRDDLLVHFLVREALETGRMELFQASVSRNFIHVRDTARAFLFAIDNYDRLHGQIYNLGNPEMGVAKLEIAEMIRNDVLPNTIIEVCDAAGKDLDNRNNKLSFAKLCTTGFKFEYPFIKGLQEILVHYQQKNRNNNA